MTEAESETSLKLLQFLRIYCQKQRQRLRFRPVGRYGGVKLRRGPLTSGELVLGNLGKLGPRTVL